MQKQNICGDYLGYVLVSLGSVFTINPNTMATINYLVKGKKNFTNILLRFKDGRRFDITTSTDIKIEPNKWSKSKQKVRLTASDFSKDEINNHLKNLKYHIIDHFNSDNTKGIPIDLEWLKLKIARYFNRPVNEKETDKVFFLPFIDNFIDLAPTRFVKGKDKPVSNGTIRRYRTTLNKLKQYEKRFKTKLKFTDLNLEFHKKFVNFLSKEQNISNNTISNYLKTTKAIAREAKLQGLPVHEQIDHPKFFAPTSKADTIYLRNQEINTIYNHNFENNERLDNARDLFIIGLRTGLRVSDFLRLKQTNIKEGYFEIETKKTGQNVIIPMHPQVKEVLKKRNEFPHKISDQKFNLYIKEIAKEVGLTQIIEGSKINPETKRKQKGIYPKHELVTSHICRRSFASNLYGKLPNMVIMAITGHQTEAQFLKYIKITPKENAQKLQEYWQKQQEENRFEKLTMKIVT